VEPGGTDDTSFLANYQETPVNGQETLPGALP
jgi:hypothetical protein